MHVVICDGAACVVGGEDGQLLGELVLDKPHPPAAEVCANILCECVLERLDRPEVFHQLRRQRSSGLTTTVRCHGHPVEVVVVDLRRLVEGEPLLGFDDVLVRRVSQVGTLGLNEGLQLVEVPGVVPVGGLM